MTLTPAQQEQLAAKLDAIERTLVSIRDQKQVDAWAHGQADLGQGQIANLRAFLYQTLKGEA
jgi:hypothetical protein